MAKIGLQNIKDNAKPRSLWALLTLAFPLLCSLLSSALLTSCYQQQERVRTPFEFTERQLDSLAFLTAHHYTNNYNFVVSADSLVLHRSTPSEILGGMSTDSFVVYKEAHLVVAEILILHPGSATAQVLPDDEMPSSTDSPANSAAPASAPQDPDGTKSAAADAYLSDSVWVQLANDTSAFGWVQERTLLKRAQPDDPISAFISTFSDSHLIIFLGIIAFFSAIYLIRSLSRRQAHMVHINDIPSFYPTLLCLLVAFSASLYAAIQTLVPQMWQHFYFHPTLNPFSVPMPLSLFLCTVWALLIVALAAADDVRHILPLGEAILYLGGLAAMCAICYIVFSITCLYFVGYILLIVYAYYALRQYLRHGRAQYRCGRCGAKMQKKGTCPHCGATNL